MTESAAGLLERIRLGEDSWLEVKHSETGTESPFTRVMFGLDRA